MSPPFVFIAHATKNNKIAHPGYGRSPMEGRCTDR
jgi:hypothetical protein